MGNVSGRGGSENFNAEIAKAHHNWQAFLQIK